MSERHDRNLETELEKTFRLPQAGEENIPSDDMWRSIESELWPEPATDQSRYTRRLGRRGKFVLRPVWAWTTGFAAVAMLVSLIIYIKPFQTQRSSAPAPVAELGSEILTLESAIADLEGSGDELEISSELSPAFEELDRAIVDAMTLLKDDPENAKVRTHLIFYMEQKLCLLRSTTSLPGSSGGKA